MKPGCYNRPRQESYFAQNGWREYLDQQGNPVRMPVWMVVSDVMSVECQWSKTNKLAACKGCKWKTTGRRDQKS